MRSGATRYTRDRAQRRHSAHAPVAAQPSVSGTRRALPRQRREAATDAQTRPEAARPHIVTPYSMGHPATSCAAWHGQPPQPRHQPTWTWVTAMPFSPQRIRPPTSTTMADATQAMERRGAARSGASDGACFFERRLERHLERGDPVSRRPISMEERGDLNGTAGSDADGGLTSPCARVGSGDGSVRCSMSSEPRACPPATTSASRRPGSAARSATSRAARPAGRRAPSCTSCSSRRGTCSGPSPQ